MVADSDIKFMRRALELASLGIGRTSPNPAVGAVIVHEGRIIGEGYHTRAGEPHAEVNAVASAPAGLLKEASIYVSLEPCSHHGRTPPCADMLVEKGFRRVVIGTIDTSSKVSGRGIARLQEGGCEVVYPVLEDECRMINRRFFTFHEKARPWVILKWAESADGFIDRERKEGEATGPNWITGKEERVLVHTWRATEDAILAGKRTVIADNPSLDVRYVEGRNPLRVVLGGDGRLPGKLKIFEDDNPLLLFTRSPLDLREGKEIIVVSDGRLDTGQIFNELVRRDVQSLIVEGGADTLQQFIDEGKWDEARIFRGRKTFGNGIPAPLIEGEIIEERQFTESVLTIMKR